MDENIDNHQLSGKEAYEARRREKLRKRETETKEGRGKKQASQLVKYLIIVLALVAAGYGLFWLAQS